MTTTEFEVHEGGMQTKINNPVRYQYSGSGLSARIHNPQHNKKEEEYNLHFQLKPSKLDFIELDIGSEYYCLYIGNYQKFRKNKFHSKKFPFVDITKEPLIIDILTIVLDKGDFKYLNYHSDMDIKTKLLKLRQEIVLKQI